MEAGGETELGYSYTGEAATGLITSPLAKAVQGLPAFDPPRAWEAMRRVVRNLGRPGLIASADQLMRRFGD